MFLFTLPTALLGEAVRQENCMNYVNTISLIPKVEVPKLGFALVTLPVHPIGSLVVGGSALLTLYGLKRGLSVLATHVAQKTRDLFTAYQESETLSGFFTDRGMEILTGIGVIGLLAACQYPICGTITSLYIQVQGLIFATSCFI